MHLPSKHTGLSLLLGLTLMWGPISGGALAALPAASVLGGQNRTESAAARQSEASRGPRIEAVQPDPEGIQVAARGKVKLSSAQRKAASSRQGLRLPSRSAITSRFGPRRSGFHHGLDLRAPVGTPVYAAQAGVVTFAGWRNNIYGNFVIIDHGGGLVTRYAHNSRVLVRRGQRVDKGSVIALSGNTGRSTGPHIHFEVMRNGKAIDPLKVAR